MAESYMKSLIFAIFWNFDLNMLLRANMGYFRTIIDPEKENYLFYQILNKKGKRGKRGTIYLDLQEKFRFCKFFNFLLPFQIYPFLYPFYPFFSGGWKVEYLGSFDHKYLRNRPNRKKVIMNQIFELQKTTIFVQ